MEEHEVARMLDEGCPNDPHPPDVSGGEDEDENERRRVIGEILSSLLWSLNNR